MESGELTLRVGTAYPLSDASAAMAGAGAGWGGGATVVTI
jgi:hypothetical protein